MARLIDADALKESIDEHVYLVHHGFNETEYGCTQYGIHQIIDDAPTIDAEPHWIPCSERLPEKKGEYLVTYHPCYWDDVEDEIRVGIDTFRGRTTWAKKKYQRVIAWMPLPKPYEGDKE